MKNQRKVLIIEDSPYIRDGLRHLVTRVPNIEVVGPAADGARGLELFLENAPDVVLLDLELPKMNGFALLQQIRQQSDTCLVIVLTGYNFLEFRKCCEDLGADYFLNKANEFAQVLKILQQPELHRPQKVLQTA
jgi:YesN/AraC family two-component response regulator